MATRPKYEEEIDDLDTAQESSFIAAEKLTLDLRKAAATLRPNEVRYIVSRYYQLQKDRLRVTNQLRAASEGEAPNAFLQWEQEQALFRERNLCAALTVVAHNTLPGRWCLSILGIGPVITAGLLAHIDITRAPYATNIWSYAGLLPDAQWEKGEKRPWNAALKTLCWKIGSSFVKIHNNPNDTLYGKIYKEQKQANLQRNENGGYADLAQKMLRQKNITDVELKAIYTSGKIPPGQIEAGARRQAVKMFLSHLHHVLYEVYYQKPPALPYILAHDPRHTHYVPPPNWPLVLEEKKKGGRKRKL